MTEIKPCECSTPSQGIVCKRRCVDINPERWWELCSQNCPPERPCDEDDSITVRKFCDEGRIKLTVATTEQVEEGLFKKFLNAITEELKWRASGGRGPTAEEKAVRRQKCEGCKEYHDEEKDRCKACGCFLEAGFFPPRPMGKLDCATQRCPRGWWESVGGYKAKGCGGNSASRNRSNTPKNSEQPTTDKKP